MRKKIRFTTVPLLLSSFLASSLYAEINTAQKSNKEAHLNSKKEEIVVYTSRNEELIKPVFDMYTKETGVQVVYHTGKAGLLMQKILSEGKKTPADVLLTVDAGNLWAAKEKGILAPVESSVLNKNVDSRFRDPQGYWYGFSLRARTIVYNPDQVKVTELSSYEDLALPKWKDRLCLRTSKKVYNQSLVAMMIEQHGEAKTEGIVKGWVSNLATDVFSNDTKLIEAVAAGKCGVGVVNSYYFGRLVRKKPDLKAKLFWPDAKLGGVHVNVSGGALVANSDNKKVATQFLEFLSSTKAQKMFASLNLEYPVSKSVDKDPLVQSWGSFEYSKLNLDFAGKRQIQAIKLMDRAKYR